MIPEGELTAPGVMAPAGLGYGGYSVDFAITKYILGKDPWAAAVVGRDIVNSQKEEHKQVALALARYGEIGPAQINQAYKEAKNIRLGIRPVQIEITKPTGEKTRIKTYSDQWRVAIPDI